MNCITNIYVCICFQAKSKKNCENSYINTLIMKLLKSSLEKENDDHDIFGAYVAMEMRNLKNFKAQTLLRTEIRNAISRVISKESTTTNEHTGYPIITKREKNFKY